MKTTLMIGVLVVGAGCAKKAEDGKPTEPTAKKEPAPKKEAAPATPSDQLVLDKAGFETPESVLYDATGDVYLVSNIAGTPADKDDNAFISRVDPDGKVDLKWIDSAKEGVELDAPKGSAIIGDVLYVADIDVVRMFDRATGAPKGDIAIEGAAFLNDVAVSGDTLWVSDTGVKFGAGGPEPTGTDAVYAIATKDGNTITKAASGKELGMPNGLAVNGERISVVTFGTGEMYELIAKDGAWTVDKRIKPPKGQLDGIVISGGKTLVSSWEGKAIYSVAADGTATEVIGGLDEPADIGFDTKRSRLLIPLFGKNTVEIRPLP
jgi:hypothetical protein